MNETTKNPTNHSKSEFGIDAHEPYKEQKPNASKKLDNTLNSPVEKPVLPLQQVDDRPASKRPDINKNIIDTSVGAPNSWVFDTSQATQRLGDSVFLKKATPVQGYVKARSAFTTNREPVEETITKIKLKQNGEKQKYSPSALRSDVPWPLGGFAPGQKQNRQDIVSITYEEIGFFPRSFNRVFDRFLKQVFSDVENLVIQEYRFYRYLFLTTLKCMLILFFVPCFVNYLSKTYLVSPLTEYFWNTQQSEIFLNSYQQKRAFTELKDFEEKLYFESLINCGSKNHISPPLTDNTEPAKAHSTEISTEREARNSEGQTPLIDEALQQSINRNKIDQSNENATLAFQAAPKFENNLPKTLGTSSTNVLTPTSPLSLESGTTTSERGALRRSIRSLVSNNETAVDTFRAQSASSSNQNITYNLTFSGVVSQSKTTVDNSFVIRENEAQRLSPGPLYFTTSKTNQIEGSSNAQSALTTINNINPTIEIFQKTNRQEIFEQRLQEKTIELAFRYNNQSIEAITNFFADLLSFITLCYLLIVLEIQVNITKSFLLEVFFGLDDGKKSLLILLITDLLVGYHSSNLWELFFEFLFNHYGLPESQTGIFLLVATLPVLLDVLFKYLIFRHLNRSSPATVATYHAIIE